MQFPDKDFQYDPAQDRRAVNERSIDSYNDSYNDGIGHKFFSFIHTSTCKYTYRYIKFESPAQHRYHSTDHGSHGLNCSGAIDVRRPRQPPDSNEPGADSRGCGVQRSHLRREHLVSKAALSVACSPCSLWQPVPRAQPLRTRVHHKQRHQRRQQHRPSLESRTLGSRHYEGNGFFHF